MLVYLLRPLQSEVCADVGVLAVRLRVRTTAELVGDVDEFGVVGRLEDVGSGSLAYDAESSCHFQAFQYLPLHIEVVGDIGVRRVVDGVQSGVVERVVVLCRLTGIIGIAVGAHVIARCVVESAVWVHAVVLIE